MGLFFAKAADIKDTRRGATAVYTGETRLRNRQLHAQAMGNQSLTTKEAKVDVNYEYKKTSEAVEHMQSAHLSDRPRLEEPWSIPQTGNGPLEKYEITVWDFRHIIKDNRALDELRSYFENRIYANQEQLNILNLFQLVLIYAFTIVENSDLKALKDYIEKILSDFGLEDRQEEILDLLIEPRLWGFLIEYGQGDMRQNINSVIKIYTIL